MVDSAVSGVFESWHDFYMLTGSAAATLVGLIFVAVSLHIDVITRFTEKEEVGALANQTFRNFIIVLSIAFVFMVPDETPKTSGFVLMILGVWQLASTARLWSTYARQKEGRDQVLEPGQFLSELLVPNTICYLALVGISWTMIGGSVDWIGWMVMVVIWLTISALVCAWILMLSLAQFKRAQQEAEKK